jgi:hypothetical protein
MPNHIPVNKKMWKSEDFFAFEKNLSCARAGMDPWFLREVALSLAASTGNASGGCEFVSSSARRAGFAAPRDFRPTRLGAGTEHFFLLGRTFLLPWGVGMLVVQVS